MITLKPHISPGFGWRQLHDALTANAQGAVGHLATAFRQLHGQVDHRVALPPRSASAAHAVAVLVAGLQTDAAAQRLETTAQEEVLRNAQHAQHVKHTKHVKNT